MIVGEELFAFLDDMYIMSSPARTLFFRTEDTIGFFQHLCNSSPSCYSLRLELVLVSDDLAYLGDQFAPCCVNRIQT